MLRLLEAELRYDRLRIGLILILSLVFFLVIWIGVKWERNRVPMVMLIVLVLTLTAVHAGEKYRISQKRDQLHASLPVSLWKTGMTHLLYPVLVLSAIIFLLFLSVLIVRPYVDYALTMPPLAHLLTLTGLVLAVNGVLLLQRDLRMRLTSKPLRFVAFLFWFLVYVAALLPFYVITNFMGVFGENTPAQHFLARLLGIPAGFMAAGLILSLLSLVSFVTRRSFADS